MPHDLVRRLLLCVPESERDGVLRCRGVRHLAELSTTQDAATTRRGFSDQLVTPTSDLTLEQFVEALSALDMSCDYDTIQVSGIPDNTGFLHIP